MSCGQNTCSRVLDSSEFPQLNKLGQKFKSRSEVFRAKIWVLWGSPWRLRPQGKVLDFGIWALKSWTNTGPYLHYTKTDLHNSKFNFSGTQLIRIWRAGTTVFLLSLQNAPFLDGCGKKPGAKCMPTHSCTKETPIAWDTWTSNRFSSFLFFKTKRTEPDIFPSSLLLLHFSCFFLKKTEPNHPV